MTDQTFAPTPAESPAAPAVDLGKPTEQAAPAGPSVTPVGTLRQVPVVGPGGAAAVRWGIVTASRVYSYDETVTGLDGKPATVTRTGVQDTVEFLSGHTVIVEH